MEERRPTSRRILIIAVLIGVFYLYLLIRSDGLPSQRDILRAIFYFITIRFQRIPDNILLLVLDGFLLLGGFILWTAFFSQFVLPVRKLNDRYNVWDRLTLYVTGQHGMAVRIENGEVKQRAGELKRRGKGVVLLDTASGAVLRNPAMITRTVGPGVVFTKRDESLLNAIDLHRQTRPQPPLGPREGENPFGNGNSNGANQEVQAHRMETSGLTRDGIEVVPNIVATFMLEGPPREPGRPFVFNEASVLKAITAGGFHPAEIEQIGDKSQVPMEILPAYLAADVFRETLRKFTLDELFTAHDNGKTAFQRIAEIIQARLTQPEVEALDAFGKQTERPVESREYKILRDSGIKVLRASVFNPRFSPEIEEKLVNQWVTTWIQRARLERDQVERRRAGMVQAGKRDALKWYAHIVTQQLDERILNLPGPRKAQEEEEQMRIVLERLVEGTLQGAVQDSNLYVYTASGEASLNEILDWIRSWGR